MKFGMIGAGAVALGFARKAMAAGHEVVLSSRRGQDSLAARLPSLGAAHPRRPSRWPQASTTSCSPFPGRMSRTRCAALPLHLVEAGLVDVGRMRIKLAEHAVDRRFDKLAVIGSVDVIVAN